MKKFILSLVAGAMCLSASAQSASEEYVEYPHAFIGVQGGASTIFLKQNGGDLKVSPTAALSVGSMFNPQWGARLNFQGIWNKLSGKEETLNYKNLTADFDVLFNITNALRDDKFKPFNLYLLGGVGAASPIDKCIPVLNDEINFRLGAMADYRLSKNVSANLEVNGNYLMGSKSTMYGDGKWKANVLLGLMFKIPFTSVVKTKALSDYNSSAPVTSVSDYDAQAAEAEAAAAAEAAAKKAKALEAARKAEAEAAAKKAEAEAKAKAAETAKAVVEPMAETIHFTIGQTNSATSFNDIVKATAEWAKKNPEKTISVAGYADKGTGTAAINERVAKNRAAAVVKALKKAGVPAKQIKEASYGDTVQPFAENDMNRCVIIEGK